MSRSALALLLLIGIGYFTLLGWSGVTFLSYAKVPVDLSVERQPVKEVVFGQTTTLEIQGNGFDQSTQVEMHLDVNNRDAIVGSFPIGYAVNDMLIDGERLFLANTDGGFQVVDINNPLVPELLQTHQPRTTVLDIEKHADKFILSCGSQGIYIYAETVNNRVKRLRRLYMSGLALESRVVGDHLYVAAGSRGALIYDLSNGADGLPVAVVNNIGSVLGVESFGEYLYFASTSGLLVYQLTDPEKPQYVGTILPGRIVRDAIRQQDKLFLRETGKVSLYRLGPAALPELLDGEVFVGKPVALQIIDQSLYVSDLRSGIHSLSILSQGTENEGFVDVGGTSRAIAGRGDYLYVGSNAGLQIVDRRAVLPRQQIVKLGTGHNVYDLLIKDAAMLIADGLGGAKLHSLEYPAVPAIQLTADPARKLYLDNDQLYIAKAQAGVEVFDISDISSPKPVAGWPDLTSVIGLQRFGHYLLLARGANGLFLVGLSDFNKPVVLDSISDSHAMGVVISAGMVFVAAEKAGVSIFNITEQGRLELVSKIVPPFPLNSFSAAMSLTVKDGIAYIANGEGGLLIADVRNPHQPIILSSLALPGVATALLIEGQKIYVSSTFSGIHIVDISRLTKPRLLSRLSNYGRNDALQLFAGKIFLANRSQGVSAYPLPQEIKVVDVISSSLLRVTLPSPAVPGRYSLRVRSREQAASLDGVLQYESLQNL